MRNTSVSNNKQVHLLFFFFSFNQNCCHELGCMRGRVGICWESELDLCEGLQVEPQRDFLRGSVLHFLNPPLGWVR